VRKLIERDNVNFDRQRQLGAGLAMAQISNEKGVLHIVPGGHTDGNTGATCHRNVFRYAATTSTMKPTQSPVH
jgi:branched-chain amino acid transport system substrate-binding protein